MLRWPNGTDTIGLSVDVDFTASLTRDVHRYRVSGFSAALCWLPSLVRRTNVPFNSSHFLALGHSIGGSASVTFAPQHPKVMAAVNFDSGFSQHDTVVTDVGRPVLLLSGINHTTQYDPPWAESQKHQTVWWEYISIYSAHLDYCDTATWTDTLGLGSFIQEQFGPIGGFRATQLARKFVSDFFGWIEGKGKEGHSKIDFGMERTCANGVDPLSKIE